MKTSVLSIVLAGIWITVSEFVRNEFLLKGYWVRHFESLGIEFVTLPVNGVLWMVWSFLLAALIFLFLRRYTMVETLFIAWSAGFVMMWITVFNLQVLPLGILVCAVPLSLLEIGIAELIISRVSRHRLPAAA